MANEWMEVQIYTFLKSVLDGGEWSVHILAALPLEHPW
jgi:hypothetical protein